MFSLFKSVLAEKPTIILHVSDWKMNISILRDLLTELSSVISKNKLELMHSSRANSRLSAACVVPSIHTYLAFGAV